MKNSYTTIVIGASIAGLSTARHLEEDCIVLDKKEEIGVPVKCAEGVSLQALKRENIEPDPKWIVSYIDWVKKIMPNGACWGKRKENAFAAILNRTKFEKFLSKSIKWEIKLNSCVKGIERENKKWKITTRNGEVLRSTYIVGADGPLSIVAGKVFNKRHVTIPAVNYELFFEKNKVRTNEIVMYFGNRIAPGGYAWIFPTSDHSANIGIGTGENAKKLRDHYGAFLHTVVKPLYGAYKTGEKKSGVLPIDGFSDPVLCSNAFLVGDAGSFTDPIFSGGVNMALLTGRLCGESINRHKPAAYRKSIEMLPFTGEDLARARKIFYGFSDDVLNELAEVPRDRGASHIDSGEGEKEFSLDDFIQNRMNVMKFAQTWNLAEKYVW